MRDYTRDEAAQHSEPMTFVPAAVYISDCASHWRWGFACGAVIASAVWLGLALAKGWY